MFLWWCFCGGVFVVVFLWWCFCGGVFVVVWWCFCVGVMVFLCWCVGACYGAYSKIKKKLEGGWGCFSFGGTVQYIEESNIYLCFVVCRLKRGLVT